MNVHDPPKTAIRSARRWPNVRFASNARGASRLTCSRWVSRSMTRCSLSPDSPQASRDFAARSSISSLIRSC